MAKTKILLKVTGTILSNSSGTFSADTLNELIAQIKQLHTTHQFGIVIGGGNLFRGNQQSKQLGIDASVGHHVGMLATMMNGLIIKNLLEKHGVHAELFCALACPSIGKTISHQEIQQALQEGKTIVFSGGTGSPFFTTDTNAVLRSLQISANEIWKGTDVDGVYTENPKNNVHATRIPKLTYEQAIEKQLGIMDLTAYTMAHQYKQRIRVFDIFTPSALLKAAQDSTFGSTIE